MSDSFASPLVFCTVELLVINMLLGISQHYYEPLQYPVSVHVYRSSDLNLRSGTDVALA